MSVFLILLIANLGTAKASVPPSEKVILSSPTYDEVEGLALAHALYRDGHLALAEKIASQYRDEGSVLYFYLSARMLSDSGQIDEASAKLESAWMLMNKSSAFDAEVVAFMGTLGLAKKSRAECSRAFGLLRKLGKLELSSRTQELDCDLLGSDLERFWHHLEEAKKIFPREELFSRIEIEELLKHGLSGLARERTFNSFQQPLATDLLRRRVLEIWESHRPEDYPSIVEFARLTANEPGEFTALLARSRFERSSPIVALDLFANLSLEDPKFHHIVSELARNEDMRVSADYHGFFLGEEKDWIRQKIAFATEKKNWCLVSTLEGPVKRSLRDPSDEIFYSLGYALMKTGRYVDGKSFLNRIRPDAPESVRAAKLLATMNDCLALEWTCRL